MLNDNFVYLALLISFIGIIPYTIDTIKGKVKPNRVTWFLWSFVPFIAFISQIKQGVGIQSLFTFMTAFTPAIVFLASFFNKKAYWKIGRLDITCGILSILGVILWQLTSIANLAIFFSIMADFLAALPTVVKSWFEPETENYIPYLTAAISALITILTIKIWNFETGAFSIYILFMMTLIGILVKFKVGNLLKK